MQALIVQGMDEGLQDMFLTSHVAEGLGSPFSRQYLVSHLIPVNIKRRISGYRHFYEALRRVNLACPLKSWRYLLPATPRHMSQLLPLLPSGPGGVHSLSLRGDQQEIPLSVKHYVSAITAAHYE